MHRVGLVHALRVETQRHRCQRKISGWLPRLLQHKQLGQRDETAHQVESSGGARSTQLVQLADQVNGVVGDAAGLYNLNVHAAREAIDCGVEVALVLVSANKK